MYNTNDYHCYVNSFSRIFCDYRLAESSVLDPIRAWSIGTSMVFVDLHNPNQIEANITSVIATERFRDNGGCGYVLKPRYAISKGAAPFPPVYLIVHIISAQWLPKTPITTAIEVFLFFNQILCTFFYINIFI